MRIAIQIMTDEELRHCRPQHDEPCFGSLYTAKGHLPLRAMDVQTKIVGLVSHVTLKQSFENTFAEPIEGTYIFPLPDRSGVTGFRMEVNGRIVEGEIKERGQARREYDEAIRTGHRAAITEEERAGVFTMRVGNLMPGEVATVRLTMTGPLPYDEGEATFRFPLVVAPRYIPGRALAGRNVGDGSASDTDAVPDASRISPPVLLAGYPSPVALSMSLELAQGGLPISDIRSSLHVLEEHRDRRHTTRILTLVPGERLDRDFIVRFRVGDEAVKTSLALTPDEGAEGREGTFMLTLVPPVSLSRSQKPRDIIFVLDRSGSMEGWKMVAARRAVARMVDTLREKDRFNVFAFDDRVDTPPSFQDTLIDATDRNRFRAVEFLATLESRGGTEMAQPLALAADRLAGGYDDRERVLVLVTDGQVSNEDQILKNLAPRVRNLRIFTLGVDRAVNAAFLKRLAALGGGMSELVESEDRLDDVMDKIHRRIGTPMLTELSLVPSGLEVVADSVVPSRLPDLFAGAPLFITGRYRGMPQGSLMLAGRDAIGSPWSEQIGAELASNAAITTIWARGQVRELEDRFVTGKGDRGTLERQIIATSLRFQVLCRFTAFLAIDRAERVNPGGHLHKVTQGVEAPEGWDMLGRSDAKGKQEQRHYRRAGAGGQHVNMTNSSRPPAKAAAAPQEVERMRSLGEVFEQDEEATTNAFDAGPPTAAPARMMPDPAPSGAKAGVMKKSVAQAPKKPKPVENRRPEASEGEIDLAPYRQRAKSMLVRLRDEASARPSHAARLAALSILAAHLRTLVEDLETIGVSGAAFDPLRALVLELRARLAASQLNEHETLALWAHAENVLETFADAPDQYAPPSSREDFWK